MWWSLVRGYLRTFHRLRVHGREHLPTEPPFVIVANHASHLDALCVGTSLPMKHGERTFPLAAGDLFFEKPTAAAISALAINALPVWRKKVGKKGLIDLRTRLIDDRCIYILFPEGTRRRGDEMGRFRPGIGMFVAGTEIPVVPCWIQALSRPCRPAPGVHAPGASLCTSAPPRNSLMSKTLAQDATKSPNNSKRPFANWRSNRD